MEKKGQVVEVKTNRMKGQRFVFNQDCHDMVGSATPGDAQEWMRNWYRLAFAAGAGVFVADVALPDVVETKDKTEVWVCNYVKGNIKIFTFNKQPI